jgi:hypothetical protein
VCVYFHQKPKDARHDKKPVGHPILSSLYDQTCLTINRHKLLLPRHVTIQSMHTVMVLIFLVFTLHTPASYS